MGRRLTARSRPKRQPGSEAGQRPRAPVKERALRLLGVRERSREELRRRLIMAGYHPSEIEPALDDLAAVGLVDDERFARALAEHELERRRMGRRGALVALRRKGIGPELAERTVDDVASTDDEERALELARSRTSRLIGLEPEAARRRLVGFLQRRGYGSSTAWTVARRVLGEQEDEPA